VYGTTPPFHRFHLALDKPNMFLLVGPPARLSSISCFERTMSPSNKYPFSAAEIDEHYTKKSFNIAFLKHMIFSDAVQNMVAVLKHGIS